MNPTFRTISLVAASLSTVCIAGQAFAQDITGAGASFPAPVYAKWAADYNNATGVKVNYRSIGSGGGIKQIDSKTVDFGASDMPLTDDVLKSKVLERHQGQRWQANQLQVSPCVLQGRDARPGPGQSLSLRCVCRKRKVLKWRLPSTRKKGTTR